jgi:hypothetical protein
MNYDTFTQLAIDQINNFGRNVVLIDRQASAYDPITNTITQPDETVRTVKAVFTEYKTDDIDGTVIQRGDKLCLIAGDVDQGLILKDGLDEYKIVSNAVVQPGDVVILSKLQVRR